MGEGKTLHHFEIDGFFIVILYKSPDSQQAHQHVVDLASSAGVDITTNITIGFTHTDSIRFLKWMKLLFYDIILCEFVISKF